MINDFLNTAIVAVPVAFVIFVVVRELTRATNQPIAAMPIQTPVKPAAPPKKPPKTPTKPATPTVDATEPPTPTEPPTESPSISKKEMSKLRRSCTRKGIPWQGLSAAEMRERLT